MAQRPRQARSGRITRTQTGIKTEWTTWIGVFTAIVAAIGALVFNGFATMATNEQLAMTRESGHADRFSKAVEQLGSDSVNVRLGGVYALGTLMQSSPADAPTIINVLAAFVRDTLSDRPEKVAIATRYERPAIDVTAAFDVLASRIRPDNAPYEPEPVDVRMANINGMDLARSDFRLFDFTAANMTAADLRFCDFRRSILQEARMIGTSFHGAKMSGAVLARVDATGANLSNADMQGAWLIDAVLQQAKMGGANLAQASLQRAILVHADLSSTDLRGADLTDADLRGANLHNANLLGAILRGTKLDGAETEGASGLPTPKPT